MPTKLSYLKPWIFVVGFSANKLNKKKKKNPKAFRIKALQPPNQNIVNVKEVLEQSVIQFSQVQIIYIYIYYCVLTAIVEASTAMRCYQTMRLSLSLSLSLHFLHSYKSSLLDCHGEAFGCCRRWTGCAWPIQPLISFVNCLGLCFYLIGFLMGGQTNVRPSSFFVFFI